MQEFDIIEKISLFEEEWRIAWVKEEEAMIQKAIELSNLDEEERQRWVEQEMKLQKEKIEKDHLSDILLNAENHAHENKPKMEEVETAKP